MFHDYYRNVTLLHASVVHGIRTGNCFNIERLVYRPTAKELCIESRNGLSISLKTNTSKEVFGV